ncbi:MAG: hypothetical protein NT069_01310, partial [Planctomycetota bacterium]|nr:hypothetical protein [Planctomycetota bacterium]
PYRALLYLEATQPESTRKFRLYSVACCRRVWKWLDAEPIREAVEVAERFADGAASLADLREARLRAEELKESLHAYETIRHLVYGAAIMAAADSALEGAKRINDLILQAGGNTEASWKSQAMQVVLIHDIFGNPFQPVTFDPGWLTEPVVSLAREIYQERDFDRLPALADRLCEAGCTHVQVIEHLRQSGPHARGCWVVDLLLGHDCSPGC